MSGFGPSNEISIVAVIQNHIQQKKSKNVSSGKRMYPAIFDGEV
jgi:hypothetical protein